MHNSPLDKEVRRIIDSVDGRFAVAFRDMDDRSNELLINGHEVFHAASTMKTPVMIEIFRQTGEGNFSLDDSLIVRNEFTSIADGSSYSLSIDRDTGKLLYAKLGSSMTIRSLVYDMITVSDNLATNILIELAGPENITKTMQRIGAKHLKVLRGVEDMKAFDMGLNNTLSAYDLLIVYDALAREQAVSPSADKEMISILKDQKLNDLIPAPLPPDVTVAHKTGSISGVRHDSGIVMLPSGRRYVLVILSQNLADERTGEAAIRDISHSVFTYFAG